MKLLSQVRRCLIVGATIGILMPPPAFAAGRDRLAPIRDVALQRGGTLRGEVLSTEGQAAVGQTISLAAEGESVANATVGADGKFVIGGVRPGVYSVAVGETQNVVRLWSEAAAPPAATPELLLVEEQSQVVRGEHHGDHHLPHFDHPWLVGGLLLAAGVIGGVIGYNIRDAKPAS